MANAFNIPIQQNRTDVEANVEVVCAGLNNKNLQYHTDKPMSGASCGPGSVSYFLLYINRFVTDYFPDVSANTDEGLSISRNV